MRAYDRAARMLDIVVALVALVLTAPLQAAIALLVRRKLGVPILFRQQRPGKNDQIFELVKFRTMLEVDVERGLVTDADRMTHFGSVLRATSLDELPTIINVLKGDMSIVGPRPLLVDYLELYSPVQRRRHEVRPGITGLAQVSGRNAIGWNERLQKDVEYVDGRSLLLDLKIVWRTVFKVLRRDGITDGESSTMTRFTGSSAIRECDGLQ